MRWSRQLISVHYTNEDAWNLLGVVNRKLKRLTKAKKCYIKGLEFNPDSIKLYHNLALVYKELGNDELADEALQYCYENRSKAS